MAGRPTAQLCWDRWVLALGIAQWRGTARKRVESMKLPQDNGTEIRTKISLKA